MEDQATADTRIAHLLKVPAPVRFLSMEPLLGPVDLDAYLSKQPFFDALGDIFGRVLGEAPQRVEAEPGIGWIIVGGESGPGARPMHPDWARSLRDQAVDAGVPFFFKQWGEWSPDPAAPSGPLAVLLHDGTLLDGQDVLAFSDKAGEIIVRVGKKKAGRILGGQTWNQYPVVAGLENGGGSKV